MSLTYTLLLKTKQFASIVRLKPFDTSTLEGRSKERHRRIALTTATSMAARGIGLLTVLVSVPLTINYLGTERYGLWMAISSLIALLGFADLGMGNGLVNAIAEADGNDDRSLACKYVSSGFFILSGIAIVVMIVFAVFFPIIPWPRIFNVTTDLAAQESGPALAIFIICFLLNISLGVVHRVQLGYQEGFTSYIWQAIGSLMGLGGVLLAIYFKAGLALLVLAISGAPVLATAINWLIEFVHTRPWLFPRLSLFDWNAGKKVINIGLIFFILQVFALIGGETVNSLIIANRVSLSAVSIYSVTQKLFSVALISQLIFIPLWPAFGEAMARMDFSWVRSTLYRSIIFAVSGGALIAFLLMIFGKQIIRIWAGLSVIPPTSLLIGSAALIIMNSYKGGISTFFNSSSIIQMQMGYFIGASILSFFLKIILVNYWQISGVLWGEIIGYSIVYLIPMTIIARQILYQKSQLRNDHLSIN